MEERQEILKRMRLNFKKIKLCGSMLVIWSLILLFCFIFGGFLK